MKKIITSVCLFFISQLTFGQNNSKFSSYAEDVFYSTENRINFIRFKEDKKINQQDAAGFINSVLFDNGATKVAELKTEKDAFGFTHIKYSILQNGNLLANKVIIAHCLNGKVVSLNGDLYEIPVAENGFALTEKKALSYALAKVNAQKYKWENKEEEQHMREALNQPDFSYAPKGIKVVFEKEGVYYNAYQFNIYAEQPLYRANVFVEASNGKVLEEQNLICNADVPATAITKYSGTQPFTNDLTAGVYRMREVQRGNGVETYNMKNTSVYSATDFTNTSATWTTTGVDQAAADAHWGAEQTYDYYFTQHGRNSINNSGLKLLSYVHYQTNYANAFWDGQRMTYGDGNGSQYKIFTALDVCGHEITHGLTSNTGNLTYSNESGALNESFSDIFGTSIENYARPNNWNWKIGEDITPNNNGLRSMAAPGLIGDPDTYGGQNYYTGTADNGGVHTNSGVSNYWFYLLTQGGSGTNDLNNAYSVTGLGFTDAAKIAFRALTVYFTPSTNFAAARLLSIQAAKDLYGDCSNEVIQTTRAWYAVGVGANYVTGIVGTGFKANTTNFCSTPASVTFSNTTTSGVSYLWDFGDGTTSTATNPIHVYNAVGTYSVKLRALGCANVLDSVTKTSYVVINGPVNSPVVSNTTACENGPVTLSGSGSATLKWYNSSTGGGELGTGNSFATSGLSTTTTFYAANTMTLASVFGGKLTNSGGGAYSNVTSNYLIFDVLQPGTLNSVVVYIQTVPISSHVIQLRSSANVVLSTTTVGLSLGANTITLNYNLAPGTNYRLGLSTVAGSPAGLYRNTGGVSYPYNIGGCVNITGSNSGSTFYNYFYNWMVTQSGCASPRVPAVVTIIPAPAVTINTPFDPVCIGDKIDMGGTPAGGVYAGNTVNGSLFSATAGAGTYTVSYTYTGSNSCSSTADAMFIVEQCTGLTSQANSNNSVLIYPNPAKDNLIIAAGITNAKAIISDALGRVVMSRELTSSEEKIKIDALSKGIYIISIQDASGKSIKTIKLIKE